MLAVPALDDLPIPIGAKVTVHYHNREIEGELLRTALGRIPTTKIRNRTILVPWSTIRRKRP